MLKAKVSIDTGSKVFAIGDTLSKKDIDIIGNEEAERLVFIGAASIFLDETEKKVKKDMAKEKKS